MLISSSLCTFTEKDTSHFNYIIDLKINRYVGFQNFYLQKTCRQKEKLKYVDEIHMSIACLCGFLHIKNDEQHVA
jgi:hypothetical protein